MAGRKGAIAFGLVYIPVELFTATQDDAVRFNQLAKDTMKRVRYVKTCPDCKRELKPEDIVKGYQYEKGKYVVVDDEELDAIKTADFRKFLTAVGVDGKAMVVTPAVDQTIVKSARNIPGVVTTPASILSVYDILNAKYLVVDKDALAKIEEVYA